MAQLANRFQILRRIIMSLGAAAWFVPTLWALYLMVRGPLPRFSDEPYMERAVELSVMLGLLVFILSGLVAAAGTYLLSTCEASGRRNILIATVLGATPGGLVAVAFWVSILMAFQA